VHHRQSVVHYSRGEGNIGIVKGNPGVFQGYPDPYPDEPVPTNKGTGFCRLG